MQALPLLIVDKLWINIQTTTAMPNFIILLVNKFNHNYKYNMPQYFKYGYIKVKLEYYGQSKPVREIAKNNYCRRQRKLGRNL